jgi:hypothetical protein
VFSPLSEREQWSRQVEVLTSSHALHGSESLCRLLKYLAQHAVEQPGIPLKEYQIATEVFGRRADFDPQSDSTIRVQAGRLRAKLADYYNSEGAHDPIVVELPKGMYMLHFHKRGSGEHKGIAAEPQLRNAQARAGQSATHGGMLRSWKMAVAVLCTLLLVALAVIGWLATTRKVVESALANETESAPAEFRELWHPFATGPAEPWLVFSNAAFIGRPETGMRYYNPAKDPSEPIWDHYSGVGEVLAVHELDQVFSMLHRRLRVKRGSLFSLDDVEKNNLIFLGSPSENLTLKEIPTTRHFVFQRLMDGPRKGDLAIVNVHPEASEGNVFLATPSTSPMTDDYAVVGLLPGLDPARSVIIFAGTTTFGTQAAVEYVTRENSLKELLARVGPPKDGRLRPFEALLHVKVARGVPVGTDLLAVRQ